MTDLTPTFSAALQQYEVPWLRLDWPLHWDAVFNESQPTMLEIGFGNGAFLVELAKAHPEHNYIGIERSWGSVQRLIRSADAQRLNNVRVLQGDAPWLLQRLFEPETLDAVYVNFSDPWPKTKHHERRVIQPDFVELLAGRLSANGQVTIATDHAAYAKWILTVLERQSWLQPALGEPVVHRISGRSPTRYEAKALAAGRRIHYFVWRKVNPMPAARILTVKVDAMPNVKLHGTIECAELLRALSPQSWHEADHDTVIKLEQSFLAIEAANSGLIEMLVKEGALTQQLAMLIHIDHTGACLIKPATLGFPRPTWGVKRAVWHVTNTLLGAHPTLRVASSTVGEFHSTAPTP